MKNPFRMNKDAESKRHTVISAGEEFVIWNKTLGYFFSKWFEGATVGWATHIGMARIYKEGEGGQFDADIEYILKTRSDLHEDIVRAWASGESNKDGLTITFSSQ